MARVAERQSDRSQASARGARRRGRRPIRGAASTTVGAGGRRGWSIGANAIPIARSTVFPRPNSASLVIRSSIAMDGDASRAAAVSIDASSIGSLTLGSAAALAKNRPASALPKLSSVPRTLRNARRSSCAARSRLTALVAAPASATSRRRCSASDVISVRNRVSTLVGGRSERDTTCGPASLKNRFGDRHDLFLIPRLTMQRGRGAAKRRTSGADALGRPDVRSSRAARRRT